MRYFFGFLVMCLALAQASEVDIAQSDFFARSVNFVIFVAIVWVLLAGRARAFFAARRERISTQLSEVQDKLKTAKNNKEQALRRLEEAKEQATEIISNAKRETYLITQKVEEQSRIDIENMLKHTQSLMEFEQKRMEKQVVDEVLTEVFAQNKLNTQEYVNILQKKVV